jgi:hypothetical protein
MVSICHLGSCYWNQNRFPDHSLCCIDNIVFAVSALAAEVIVIAAFIPAADFFLQDNHAIR